MACRPGKVGRLENLGRPARVLCVVLAVVLIAGSFFVSSSQSSVLVTAAGALLLVVVLLLPVMTEFEVDVFGLRAKANLPTREQKLEATCRRQVRHVASFVNLVGVEPEQIDALVEEAIEDTCRLWRGSVDEDLVGRLLVCRSAHLIQASLRLGGPYRVLKPEGAGRYGPESTPLVALAPGDRLIVALVEWVELDTSSVAAMLDLDVRTVQQALGRGVLTGFNGASA
jgi:hypothetical protein